MLACHIEMQSWIHHTSRNDAIRREQGQNPLLHHDIYVLLCLYVYVCLCCFFFFRSCFVALMLHPRWKKILFLCSFSFHSVFVSFSLKMSFYNKNKKKNKKLRIPSRTLTHKRKLYSSLSFCKAKQKKKPF